MANRLCPICSASFVDWAVTCADCGVALVDPDGTEDPRDLAEEDQLVYELETWSLDQRAEVASVMAESGIPHAWVGDELYVHVRFESAVDQLLEPIEYPDGTPEVVESPIALPDGPLTEYDLAEWPPAACDLVATQLIEAGIAFAWDERLLLVGVDDEEATDELLDALEDSGALDELDADELDADELDADELDADELGGDETPGAVLEMLFLAADRLRKDPLDADGLADLSTAIALADPARPPYGVEPTVWRRMMGLADELVAAETGSTPPGLDGDAHALDGAVLGEPDSEGSGNDELDAELDDDIDEAGERDEQQAREIATDLRDLLRPFV